MSEEINFDGSIFGYDKLVKGFVALRGEDKPELHIGDRIILSGDTQGYVPSSFKSGEEATIIGFREPHKGANSDHIVLVTNAINKGWVKPSNIQKNITP